MFEIKKGNIFHTRGDTADFHINITIDEQPITEYEAVFSVKKTFKDEEYLFQIPIDSNGDVHISHDTTQDLPFGDFYYDIQIRIDNETEEGRYVTIGPYQYHLQPDVTTN